MEDTAFLVGCCRRIMSWTVTLRANCTASPDFDVTDKQAIGMWNRGKIEAVKWN